MAMQWCVGQQLIAPAAATGASVSITAGWGDTGYTQLHAGVGQASILTGVLITSWGTVGTFEADIATGAAASEVVIATVKFGQPANAGYMGSQLLQLMIPIDNIVNGARLSVRARGSATATILFAVTYLAKPITGSLQITTKLTKCLPAAAVGVTVTSSTAWTFGSWVQITASAAADLVMSAIVALVSSQVQQEIQIGIGAVSSEVAIVTIPAFNATAALGGPGYVILPCPVASITSGSRVSARIRSSGATTAEVSIVYQEAPL